MKCFRYDGIVFNHGEDRGVKVDDKTVPGPHIFTCPDCSNVEFVIITDVPDMASKRIHRVHSTHGIHLVVRVKFGHTREWFSTLCDDAAQ